MCLSLVKDTPNFWSSRKRVYLTKTDTWRLNSQTPVTERIGGASRNLSCLAKPTVPISTNEDEITVKTKSIFQINENSFKLREEFEETVLGGQKTKNTVTLDNDSLIQVQAWAGRETPRRRKLVDGKMAM